MSHAKIPSLYIHNCQQIVFSVSIEKDTCTTLEQIEIIIIMVPITIIKFNCFVRLVKQCLIDRVSKQTIVLIIIKITNYHV